MRELIAGEITFSVISFLLIIPAVVLIMFVKFKERKNGNNR